MFHLLFPSLVLGKPVTSYIANVPPTFLTEMWVLDPHVVSSWLCFSLIEIFSGLILILCVTHHA